jgi:uncharacterized protein
MNDSALPMKEYPTRQPNQLNYYSCTDLYSN